MKLEPEVPTQAEYASTTSQPIAVYPNQGQAITIATLFIIVGSIGMVANSLVLVAVSLSRKLQTQTNAFVVNLSISDFLTCFALPFHAVGILSSDGWPLSNIMCRFVAALTITTPICSVLTLAMIAVNRYTLITKSKKTYQKMYRLGIVAILVAVTWLVPVFTLVVPQLTNLGGLGYDEFYKICKWDVDLSKIPIFQSIASLTFLIATGVITFCYISIYLHVRKHIEGMKAKRQSQVISMQSISVEEATQGTPRQRSPTNHNLNGTPSLRQVKITQNLCIVVVIFFICVVPYSVLLLCQVRHLAVIYLAVVFVLSSNINPMLYAAKHPDFRRVFGHMFRCDFADIPHPSGCLRGIIQKTGATPNTKSSSES
ncbi:melatonin receptor type 1B-A-like [Diadema setosum]|uniref:melatonin receptor type 1B-A-like n=1 Tax=Diadema setosum TaxID=31175 RepID=UPI003B3A479E